MNQVSDVLIHHRAALRPPRPAPQGPALRSTKVLDQLRERIAAKTRLVFDYLLMTRNSTGHAAVA